MAQLVATARWYVARELTFIVLVDHAPSWPRVKRRKLLHNQPSAKFLLVNVR